MENRQNDEKKDKPINGPLCPDIVTAFDNTIHHGLYSPGPTISTFATTQNPQGIPVSVGLTTGAGNVLSTTLESTKSGPLLSYQGAASGGISVLDFGENTVFGGTAHQPYTSVLGFTGSGGVLSREMDGKLATEMDKKEIEVELKKIREEEKANKEEIKKLKEESRVANEKIMEFEQKLAIGKELQQVLAQSKKNKNTKEIEKRGLISFNRKTGEVFLGRNTLGELKPGKDYFCFFEVLFDTYPIAINFENLAKATAKKVGKEKYSDSHDDYCYKAKSKLKKESPKICALIEFFPDSKGKNGCKLINSEKQKIVRKSRGFRQKK